MKEVVTKKGLDLVSVIEAVLDGKCVGVSNNAVCDGGGVSNIDVFLTQYVSETVNKHYDILKNNGDVPITATVYLTSTYGNWDTLQITINVHEIATDPFNPPANIASYSIPSGEHQMDNVVVPVGYEVAMNVQEKR